MFHRDFSAASEDSKTTARPQAGVLDCAGDARQKNHLFLRELGQQAAGANEVEGAQRGRGRGKGVQAQERQRKSPFIIHAGGIIISAVAFEINNRLRLGKLYVKKKKKRTEAGVLTGGEGGWGFGHRKNDPLRKEGEFVRENHEDNSLRGSDAGRIRDTNKPGILDTSLQLHLANVLIHLAFKQIGCMKNRKKVYMFS